MSFTEEHYIWRMMWLVSVPTSPSNLRVKVHCDDYVAWLVNPKGQVFGSIDDLMW